MRETHLHRPLSLLLLLLLLLITILIPFIITSIISDAHGSRVCGLDANILGGIDWLRRGSEDARGDEISNASTLAASHSAEDRVPYR